MSLLSASTEILRDVLLYAIGPIGPPQEWFNLVLCCKTFYRQLDTPVMHALLFAKKFHVPLDVQHLLPAHAKTEMKRRFLALKLFRRGELCFKDHASFTDALWVAYVMLRAAEPRQTNVDQLLWAGLPPLLLLFLKQRLNDGAEKNHGWPLVNDTNSLAIALMWLLSSESSVRAESPAIRDAVMERIRPYVLAAFRYPLASLQGECFGSNSPLDLTISRTIHEGYSMPSPPQSREVAYFGSRRVDVPSAPIYSILCYFTRLDILTPMFPVHLSSRAQTAPRTGPRREDVEHFINDCRTRFEPWDLVTKNPRSDESYLLGSLTGRWQGSSIVPCLNSYRHWLNDAEAPETMDTFCRQPLYITLQEYVSYAEAPVVSDHKVGRGKQVDACQLPSTWVEKEDGIEIQDEYSKRRRFYRKAGGKSSRQETVDDIIIAGQTDDPYASAWGAFKLVGRVRLTDGLIVLKRESVAGLGTTVFRGYMSSPQNFVGRYRALPKGYEVAEWEAAFSLCKVN
ncbi:hypothetical protein R3P38DRAFT_1358485 [Favolaschia claudopus]|uniref:F-box domain-containing protein n=1 Tax=Favolaschia claudopus TaxID=2862362 RepID=A0AAW0DWG9_9AGAR